MSSHAFWVGHNFQDSLMPPEEMPTRNYDLKTYFKASRKDPLIEKACNSQWKFWYLVAISLWMYITPPSPKRTKKNKQIKTAVLKISIITYKTI